MDISVAINAASNFANTFKAFKELEEFLIYVARMEQQIKEANSELSSIKYKIAEERENLEIEREEMRDLLAHISKLRGDLEHLREQSDAEITRLKKEVADNESQCNEQIMAMNEYTKEQSAVHAAYLEKLEIEKEAARRQLAELEHKRAEFIASLGI